MRQALHLIILSGTLLFSCNTTKLASDRYTATNKKIDTTLSSSPQMEGMLRPYRTGMSESMELIIGYTKVPLTKAQPECTSGNFITDAMYAITLTKDKGLEIAVLNYGAIRLPFLNTGAITMGRLYELMPFDNQILILEIPGKTLKIFCDLMAGYGGWPVKGLSYTIDNRKATNILVNSVPLNDQLMYKVAVPDYIANGGDNCDMLTSCTRNPTHLMVRDAMIKYITERGGADSSIHPVLENRVSYAR